LFALNNELSSIAEKYQLAIPTSIWYPFGVRTHRFLAGIVGAAVTEARVALAEALYAERIGSYVEHVIASELERAAVMLEGAGRSERAVLEQLREGNQREK
jgi:hypothetical protein